MLYHYFRSTNPKIQTFKQEQESLEEKLITTKNQLDSLKLLKIIEDLNVVGLPKSDFKDEVITHSAMILGYAEEFEQARWVTHIITPYQEFPIQTKRILERKNDLCYWKSFGL